MGGPEISQSMKAGSLISFVVLCVWLWFVPFSINLAFWIGISIIIFGHVVNSLAYGAMREHPEKKQKVVDWGIYKVTRHPHFHHGLITTLGTIVMGWNTGSIVYLFLWAYLILDIVFNHFAILQEEKRTAVKFGQEYVDYITAAAGKKWIYACVPAPVAWPHPGASPGENLPSWQPLGRR